MSQPQRKPKREETGLPRTPVDDILDPEPKGPTLNSVSRLIDAWKSSEDRRLIPMVFSANNETFQINFRMPASVGEFRNCEEKAFDFLHRMKDKSFMKAAPAPYREAMGIRELDPDDMITAWFLHFWSHPTTPITEVNALFMVAFNPVSTRDVVGRLDRIHRGSFSLLSFGAVQEKKRALEGFSPDRIRMEGAVLYGIGKHPDDMDERETDRLQWYMALFLVREEQRIKELRAIWGGS